MKSETRLTRQGLRDLNHYGPKRPPAATTAPKVVEESTIVPAPLAATEIVAPQPKEE